MTDTTTTTDAETQVEGGEQQQEHAFTQAEVDRIVRDRLAQQAKNKFGDYEELKTRAAGAQTLEERLGSLEQELTQTKTTALRASVAARFGISTEKGENDSPSDADLFLTGTDEATLTAQAQRLAGRQAESKTQGNVARKEGGTKTTGTADTDAREFVTTLFGGAD